MCVCVCVCVYLSLIHIFFSTANLFVTTLLINIFFNVSSLTSAIKAVSYTHLDVYKRQALTNLKKEILELPKKIEETLSVSESVKNIAKNIFTKSCGDTSAFRGIPPDMMSCIFISLSITINACLLYTSRCV